MQASLRCDKSRKQTIRSRTEALGHLSEERTQTTYIRNSKYPFPYTVVHPPPKHTRLTPRHTTGCMHASFQVLMVEPPLNERAQRQEMAGMMFETFKVFAKQFEIPVAGVGRGKCIYMFLSNARDKSVHCRYQLSALLAKSPPPSSSSLNYHAPRITENGSNTGTSTQRLQLFRAGALRLREDAWIGP